MGSSTHTQSWDFCAKKGSTAGIAIRPSFFHLASLLFAMCVCVMFHGFLATKLWDLLSFLTHKGSIPIRRDPAIFCCAKILNSLRVWITRGTTTLMLQINVHVRFLTRKIAFCGHLEVIWGHFWGLFRDPFSQFLRSLRTNFEVISVNFWGHYRPFKGFVS